MKKIKKKENNKDKKQKEVSVREKKGFVSSISRKVRLSLSKEKLKEQSGVTTDISMAELLKLHSTDTPPISSSSSNPDFSNSLPSRSFLFISLFKSLFIYLFKINIIYLINFTYYLI